LTIRGTDVSAMMTRVEATLAAAERSPAGATGVLPVAPEGDAEVNVAVLRKSADIRLDFPPGSARPLVGPAVRLGKRTLRRAVRWYVTPMMEQQGRFNHALLDAVERLRVRLERLAPAPLSMASADAGVPPFDTGRAVAVGPEAPALLDLLAGDSRARPDVRPGDAADRLGELAPGSLDAVVCDVSGLGPAPVVAALEAARSALVPGGSIVLSAADVPASLRPAALGWALSATGFVEVAAPGAPAGAGSGDLADQLGRVDTMARTRAVLTARRPR
jgi:hypothetical protein